MSILKCCVPGCPTSPEAREILHKFPNPAKNKELFNKWVFNIGGDIIRLENDHIFKYRRVCHVHFEEKYWCRNSRLSNIAEPTKNMPGISLLKSTFTFREIRPLKRTLNKSNASTSSEPMALFSEAQLQSFSPNKEQVELEENFEEEISSMSEDGVMMAKHRILEIFSELDESGMDEIELWINSLSYRKDLEHKKALVNAEKKLKKIGKSIKKIVPFEAEMPTEVIAPPTVGDRADCNKVNTCHVDEFLYDEPEVEDLVKEGKLQRHYCTDCHSRNIKDLIYISHSMSIQGIQYIFEVLLPKDLEEKHVLDIGSRLGAILYGAYYSTNAACITGIEMNEECCNVQNTIIDSFSMDKNRIKVIHSDVLERSDIVSCSDIIIINVWDFFVDVEKHKQMWYFLHKYMRKGSYLVVSRSMSDTLLYLDIIEELMDWLSVCKPSQLENEIFFDVEDCSELFLYTVN